MVKHNNTIPNVHLRKHWQRNVKVFLDQAASKKRRLIARRQKAAAGAPRPLDKLRPVVRGQTIRYNGRARLGRGFTLSEIKAVGISPQFAKSIGISVDHRRKNRCQETLELNKNRLTSYINRLVLYPQHEKHPNTKAKQGFLNDTPKEGQTASANAVVNQLPKLVKRVKAVSRLELERLQKVGAFRTLRQEWNNARNHGKRLKKAAEEAKKKQ